MKAVVLAGGKGSRLLPYTLVFPKPLIPLRDEPILSVILKQLKLQGFTEVTLALGHLADLFRTYFEDGRKFGLDIKYTQEKKPLGTVGALGLLGEMDQSFLVINGDILTSLNYSKLIDYHKEQKASLTVAVYRKKIRIPFGVIEREDKRVTKYVEKPTHEYDASMGVYVFEPEILDYIDGKEYFDLPALIKLLLEKKKRIAAFPFNGYWLDIGRPEDFVKAQEDFDKHRDLLLPQSDDD